MPRFVVPILLPACDKAVRNYVREYLDVMHDVEQKGEFAPWQGLRMLAECRALWCQSCCLHAVGAGAGEKLTQNAHVNLTNVPYAAAGI
jgi:hypothetical protein